MTTIALLAITVLKVAQATDIQSYVQPGLRDASFIAEIVSGNQQELRKINKDFGLSYRFGSSKFFFKEPFKVRIESKVEDTNVVYVINGTDQLFKLGGGHFKVDLSKSPGKRQTLLDIGMLTPSLIASLLDAKFVRFDDRSGCGVFDLTYKQADLDKSRYRVWLDKTKKYVVKREWFNQTGHQIATFNYSVPQLIGEIWFPSHLEVMNSDNIVAGVTNYTSIKLNTGLDDSLFEVK